MIVATGDRQAKDETVDYGPSLSSPICGCCRQPVEIEKSNGTPYILRGAKHTPIIVRVIWKCECQELLAVAKCIMCNKCPSCCRCKFPALEKQ